MPIGILDRSCFVPMIALTEEDIPVGKPLPWNVVDADGKVLFAQSKVVENR